MHRLLLSWELTRWRAAGRQAVLWWRDDDAREPSVALDRLLELSRRHDAPLTLAVIPHADPGALARRLEGESGVTVIQHGADHIDRSLKGAGACEFPLEANERDIHDAVSAGARRLSLMSGWRLVFTPPWNAVHPRLPAVLAGLGYEALSGWNEETPTSDMRRIDTHLDLLRWKGTPRFRGAGRFTGRLIRLLAERRRSGLWDQPIGLLTHHLDHDAAAWRFLERLLSKRHPALTWRSLPQLLDTQPQ